MVLADTAGEAWLCAMPIAIAMASIADMLCHMQRGSDCGGHRGESERASEREGFSWSQSVFGGGCKAKALKSNGIRSGVYLVSQSLLAPYVSRPDSNAVDVFRDGLHSALCPRDGTADPAKVRHHPWMQTAPAAPTESEVAATGARWAEAQIPGPQFGQRFMAIEFQCYSQNTEDGILLALLAAVGVTNRRAFELAGGVGWENNFT